MPFNKITGGAASVGRLSARKIAAGGSAFAIRTGTVGVDPPATAGSATGTATVLLTDARVGDAVLLFPAELNNGLHYTGCQVTGSGTVAAYFANSTASSINAGSTNFKYVIFDFTS